MRLTSVLLCFFASCCPAKAANQEPLGYNLQADPCTDSCQLLDSTTRDALLTLHQKLVEFESITGNEKAVGEWLASYLEERQFTVELQQVNHNRYNVLAYPGKERRTKVLVTSHIDTVPPYWPYERRADSTEIWGRGTVDAKACVAAQTIAALSLLKSPSAKVSEGDLSLLFVVGEEAGGDGMRHFSRHKPTNYSVVIFGEPTEGKLATGHKGFLGFTLSVTGRAAHSGYPWLGLSANFILVEALHELIGLEARLPRSHKYGMTTVNVGVISGGVARNVVAESAQAGIALRVAAGEILDLRKSIVDALDEVEDIVRDHDGKIEIDWVDGGYGPVDIDADVDGFDTITVNYGTDIPNLVGDHKRYLYGPGSIQVAHSDHEHLKVEELERAVKDYETLILAALSA